MAEAYNTADDERTPVRLDMLGKSRYYCVQCPAYCWRNYVITFGKDDTDNKQDPRPTST
jgi:hypothetical protein